MGDVWYMRCSILDRLGDLVRHHRAILFSSFLGDIYPPELVLGGSFVADGTCLCIFQRSANTPYAIHMSTRSRAESRVLFFAHRTRRVRRLFDVFFIALLCVVGHRIILKGPM